MSRLLGQRALRRSLTALEPERFFFGAIPKTRAQAGAIARGCQEVFRQTHGFMEGWVVLSGRYRLEIEGEFSLMRRGDCLVLPPGVCHAHYKRPNDASSVLGWAASPLSFALYLTGSSSRGARWRSAGHHLLPRADLPEAAVMEQLPARARRWSPAQVAAHAGQCLAMLFSAAKALLDERSSWQTKGIDERDLRVDAITELIDKRYYQSLSLGQIARAVGLSPAYCCHLFSTHKGMSPVAYLCKVRLDAAAKLLAETDLLVKQVAARSGFSDANYFTRRFRRAFGVTPLAYRASAQCSLPHVR